ncbi:hypothetical protein FRC01_013173, partial [Tulasnella sp. 417]
MSTTETTVIATELGLPVPSLPHAVSASLPTWQDNLGYCEDPSSVRVVHHPLSRSTPDPQDPADDQNHDQTHEYRGPCSHQPLELHIVFFPAESFKLAKSYWQWTGHGISSRRAYKCLELLDTPLPDALNLAGGFSSSSASSSGTPNSGSPGSSVESLQDGVRQNQTMQLVQCDEQPLPYSEARLVLQQRIARAVRGDFSDSSEPTSSIPQNDGSGVRLPSHDDVFLYPGGMNAIWHAHQLILQTAEQMGKVAGKSICFGFPYTDTLKILENWGPGCYFFGGGVDGDLSEVRRVAQEAASSGTPIIALFCEVTTNPLLRSPNLVELRRIADEFDFLIVVDDSIGNFVNVDVMEYTDILATSLTKVFSGRTNVMGGSLVLNPQRRHYAALRDRLKATYEDIYWHEDVVCMELNSRHFARRIDVINRNSEAVADWLWHQSEAYKNTHAEAQNSDGNKRVITNVFYPKWVMRENYDACRRRASSAATPQYPSGFGGLFTILFCDEPAARA